MLPGPTAIERDTARQVTDIDSLRCCCGEGVDDYCVMPERAGDLDAAMALYRAAASKTPSAPEKNYLLMKAARR